MRSRLPSLDLEAHGNPIRDAWSTLFRLPIGNKLFTRLLGLAAPYTSSIGAEVVALSHGHSEVRMRDRRAVRNHLRSVHAIALANLAELCGNVAVAYSLPDDGRFIVAGLALEYVKKARGTITATCDFDPPATSERRELPVPVILRDPSGEVVTRATLRTLVGPKKPRSGRR